MELHKVFFRGKYWWNEADDFFLHAFSVSTSIGNNIFFYYQRPKNYRRKIHRQSIFVGDFVGKLITNGMIVQIPMENSVGKSKDCGSGNTWLYIIPLLIPILLIRIPPPLYLHLHLCSNVCIVVKLFFNEYWNKKNWCSIKLVVFGFIVIFFCFSN
jgi:hypothetical protein